jgi:hypothetical protein
MIIGQTILAPDGESVDHFTPWFSRGADNAVMAYELIRLFKGTLAVTVYHKDYEDPGSSPASPSGSFSQLGSTGLFQANCTGLKELVRIKFTLTSGDVGCFAAFRVLVPTWYATSRI